MGAQLYAVPSPLRHTPQARGDSEQRSTQRRSAPVTLPFIGGGAEEIGHNTSSSAGPKHHAARSMRI